MQLPSRPWYRLHAATWFAGVAVAASLLVANLIWAKKPEVTLNYLHGWPLVFAERFPDAPDSWFDGGHIRRFDGIAARVDVGVGAAIVAGTGWTVERWRRERTSPPQVRLKTLCVATAWAASCFAFGAKSVEPLIRDGAIAIGLIGLALAWSAAFDMLDLGLRRLEKLRRKKRE